MGGLIRLNNPRFNYHNKGYTSIINQIIDIALHYHGLFNDFDLYVIDSQVLDVYSNVNLISNNPTNVADSFLEDFFKGLTEHNRYNAHTIINNDNLKLRNKVFTNILKLNDEISNEISVLKNKFDIGPKTLGIQIRGTDKVSEVPRISDDVIINNIFKLLNTEEINNIFLSTDDIYYVNLLSKHFSEILIYNNQNTISQNSNPIHFVGDRKKINKEVLIDVYLLSKCPYFLYCYSNVSFLSLTIGINEFKVFKNLNDED